MPAPVDPARDPSEDPFEVVGVLHRVDEDQNEDRDRDPSGVHHEAHAAEPGGKAAPVPAEEEHGEGSGRPEDDPVDDPLHDDDGGGVPDGDARPVEFVNPDRFAARLRRGDRRNEHVREHEVQAVPETHAVPERSRHLLDPERPEPEREDVEENGKNQVERVYTAEILDRHASIFVVQVGPSYSDVLCGLYFCDVVFGYR